jgi:peptidoglycan/xylan/chitin deacetylase (PgdA/CDA1 family)
MPRLFLFLLLTACSFATLAQNTGKNFTMVQGAVLRGDSTKKELALIFTADETGEGLSQIRNVLKEKNVKAGFFFTGRFYRNPAFSAAVENLAKDGHYLGPHSDQHLLYCDWVKRDSLLVTKDSFDYDIKANIQTMLANNLPIHTPQLFIPPFEWWNDSIAAWSQQFGLRLFSFTPGIRTNADYTWPSLGTVYKSSDWIMDWLKETLSTHSNGLNGAIMLLHAGTDERRTDKLYNRLAQLIDLLQTKGFLLKRIDELIGTN